MLNLNYSFFCKKRKPLKIKESAESFEVHEITEDGKILDKEISCNEFINNEKPGKFIWFILEKKNYTTEKALKEIAKALKISSSRFNHAGTKDRIAFTTQMCSAFNVKKEDLLTINLKDILIKCAFSMNRKIKLGELIGNRFSINMEKENIEFIINEGEKNNFMFPNYFGMQRFGVIQNTHLIGYEIVKGNLEQAVMIFLKGIERKCPESIELIEKKNFSKAYEITPKEFYLEKMILNELQKNNNDYAKALRKLPRNILLMFGHALQSYIFNEQLYRRIKRNELNALENESKCGSNKFGFPDINVKGDKFVISNLVGYNSELNNYEKEIMNEIDIEKENFKMKALPEITCKGSKRILISCASRVENEEDKISFILSSGNYATMFLNNYFELR